MQRNRLAAETSPYLLQHADNPVDWYPWGAEALRAAQQDDKPILLSIGYSACHWCHVMAHESFEDPATAALMNQLFVNIKVDREERPDLDKIYQLAQQLITQGSGGWPLTMFLTPDDQTPFFGGTYFPKVPRYGMPAFSGPAAARCRLLPRPPRRDRRSERTIETRIHGAAIPQRRPPESGSTIRRCANRARPWRDPSTRNSAASAKPLNSRIPAASSAACGTGMPPRPPTARISRRSIWRPSR